MKRNLKSLCAIVMSFNLFLLMGCHKDDIVGHFTVKGYLINSASGTPRTGEACRVDYSQYYLTTIKSAIEVGSGITDSSGHFEFSVELRRAGGAYRFWPRRTDLHSNEYKEQLKDGGVIDLDTL